MSDGIVALLSVSLPTIISLVFGWFLKKNAAASATGTKLQALEAQAFEKAKEQYIDAIDWQKRDNIALREEIDAMTRVKTALRADMAKLREDYNRVVRDLDICRRRCDRNEAEIKRLGGTVPPTPSE